jgi:hypothetical protein
MVYMLEKRSKSFFAREALVAFEKSAPHFLGARLYNGNDTNISIDTSNGECKSTDSVG